MAKKNIHSALHFLKFWRQETKVYLQTSYMCKAEHLG